MKNIKYESDQPLARLEPGDKAIIRVTHFPFARENDKERMCLQEIMKLSAWRRTGLNAPNIQN